MPEQNSIFDQIAKNKAPQQSVTEQAPDQVQKPKIDFSLGTKKQDLDVGIANNVKAGLAKKDASAELEAEINYPFSDEDVELAEQLMFKGWARKSYKILGGKHSIEVLTTTPLELDIQSQIVQTWMSGFKQPNERLGVVGDVFPSSTEVNSKEKLLRMSLGFQGMNGKDFCDDVDYQLVTIKNGFVALSKAIMTGNLEEMQGTKKILLELVDRRAQYMSAKFDINFLDLVASKKFELENLMMAIMSNTQTIPKS